MKTQALPISNQAKSISFSVKSDVAVKIALFAAILACINMIAFF